MVGVIETVISVTVLVIKSLGIIEPSNFIFKLINKYNQIYENIYLYTSINIGVRNLYSLSSH